jgi:hypothetical protein
MAEGEQTYSKVDLAVEQLGVALRLFLDEKGYASALTLAGAAEEILGKALEHRGRTNSMQWQYEAEAEVFRLLHGRPMKWSEFADERNQARNALKHMRAADEATLTADLEEAAVWMLVRACDNYNRLGLEPTDDMRRFDSWFYEHIVGV